MKKFGILTLVWVILLCMVTWCAGDTVGPIVREEAYLSSGSKTADALILTGRGVLKDLVLNTDGTNNAAIVIYDGVTAAGTTIFTGTCLGPNITCIVSLNRKVSTGIYADITTTGSLAYTIGYRKD